MASPAELHMTELESQWQAVAGLSADALVAAGEDGTIHFSNKAIVNLSGYSNRELKGQLVEYLVTSESLSFFKEEFGRITGAVAGEVNKAGIISIKHKQGHSVQVDLSYIKWQYRQQVFVTYNFHNLTARNEQEFQSDQMFRSLAEFSQDMIMRFDKEHRHLYVNPVVKNFTGLNKEQVLGKTHEEMGASVETARFFREVIDRVFQKKETIRIEVPVRGNTIWLHWQLVPEFDTQGEVVSVMTSARDITDLKKAEEEVRKMLAKERELGDLKSRFISMASHEFRTPMSTILSSMELIERYNERLDAEKKSKLFNQVRSAIKHMTQLLNDVLIIGKIESGKMEFIPEPTDIALFCSEIIDEIGASIGSGHQLLFTCANPVQAEVDKKLFRQVVTNLLTNAIKYSAAGSEVQIEIVRKEEAFVFSISDRGIGIPEADQDKLFETFHRASNVGNISGTGLGMSIVKNAVELHKGQITFKSAAGGTTFEVLIPLNNTDK
ncbi:MAG: PAS domain-containing sensor histidine kinase [Bacteroidia bacterium]|nr:PAS domain-containing sensor histidine kinase [Bacteroidia bacterium]